MPQSNITFFPPIVKRIQLRPTSIKKHIKQTDIKQTNDELHFYKHKIFMQL